MNKAQLVSTINELALRHDLPLVTTRPKKSVLETVLKEYMDVDKGNIMDDMDDETIYIMPEEPIEKDRLMQILVGTLVLLTVVYTTFYFFGG